MGLKYIKSFIATVLILLILGVNVFAATPLSMKIIETDVELPRLKLYVDIFDDSDEKINEAISDDIAIDVLLDGEAIEVVNIQPFSEVNEGIDYTFLIDISKSLTSNDFQNIKSMLIDWVDHMDAKDTVSIITFGEEVEVLQLHISDKITTKETIEFIELTDHGTRFYDGITKALNVARIIDEEVPDRSIIFTVTDAQDEYTGGLTKDEVIESIKEDPIPIYSLGIVSGDLTADKKENLNTLGEISRASGGIYHQMGDTSFEDILSETIASINKCYLIELNVEDRLADGKSYDLYISMEQDGKKIEDTVKVLLNNTMKDKINPEVTEIKVTEEQDVLVYFSEDVIGADVLENYELVDEGSELYNPIAVEYLFDSEKGYYAKLVFEDSVDGDFELVIANIIDASLQANAMVPHTTTLSLETTGAVVEESSFLEQYLYHLIILGVILIGLILIVVLAVINKKKKKTPAVASRPVQQSISSAVQLAHTNNQSTLEKVVMMHFAVINHKSNESTFDLALKDHLVIGRSQECDLRFNDDEMSRQHCKISYTDGKIIIDDLNATNTTMVNGVPITTRRKLESDDILLVGQTELRVSFFIE